MNKLAIEVKDLNLKYKFVKTMNFKQEIVKFITRKRKERRIKEIWALKNVSFSVKKGSTVGVIGTNGSGKTTLLKTIANIFKPDSGEVKIYEKSVSLLTLGAGFQPELSGIENIYLNGLILGLKKNEIDSKLEEMINFSELEDFINYPIKTYSSGMKTRLAFSIACHIEPDILLIDEILGVGDESFKNKSQKKLEELINENRTVLMASHNLSAIRKLCNAVLWLHKGELMAYGETEEVIKKYREFVRNSK